MLEYIKLILLKVSFSRTLFEKELRKAIRTLVPTELLQLRTWCYEQFANRYLALLDRHFAPV
ncbi:MAG: hypothetical protein H7330_02515 [Hymenobacteraceae bacterium]|nr:hypothetical protein [Hymenobacteraceae bacterium]